MSELRGSYTSGAAAPPDRRATLADWIAGGLVRQRTVPVVAANVHVNDDTVTLDVTTCEGGRYLVTFVDGLGAAP